MTKKQAAMGYLPWLIWGLAAFYYFADYSARVSPSVMLPELQQALEVTAVGLGSLSAYFYYPYVAMQIPVGILLDRYSIRYFLTVMSLVTAVACYIFGAADNLYTAQLGRFLIGFSAAFAFVSTLKLAAEWFPSNRLGLLAGLTQALGMAGAFFGAYPVSYGVSGIGWRHTMWVMAAVFVVIAIFIYLIVRDKPSSKDDDSATNESAADSAAEDAENSSLWSKLNNSQLWLNALFAGLIFAPTAVIGEFWGVSFFQFGRGFEYHSASLAVGCIFIGWMVGGPLAGWLSDKIKRRKPLMYLSAISGMSIVSIVLFVPDLSPKVAYGLLFLYGVTNMGVSIAYAIATEIVSKVALGIAIAFTNMASILIGALMQPLVGKLLDMSSGYDGARDMTLFALNNFQAAFWVLPLASATALVVAFFIKETHCKPLREQ